MVVRQTCIILYSDLPYESVIFHSLAPSGELFEHFLDGSRSCMSLLVISIGTFALIASSCVYAIGILLTRVPLAFIFSLIFEGKFLESANIVKFSILESVPISSHSKSLSLLNPVLQTH